MVTRLCIQVGNTEQHVHFLWGQQGPDTPSAGRCVKSVISRHKVAVTVQLKGTVRLEAAVGGGKAGGYLLLTLIIQEGAFREVQLALRLTEHRTLLAAWGWEREP